MNERQQAAALYRQIREQLLPLFPGYNTAVINAALAELMVEIALNQRPDKTPADAMEMLSTFMALEARQIRSANTSGKDKR